MSMATSCTSMRSYEVRTRSTFEPSSELEERPRRSLHKYLPSLRASDEMCDTSTSWRLMRNAVAPQLAEW